MPLDMLPSAYRVQLSTENPRKEVLASLDEFAALVAAAVGDGEVTQVATADQPPPRDAYALPDRAPTHEQIVQAVVDRLSPTVPDLSSAMARIAVLEHASRQSVAPDLSSPLAEAHARIAALERRVQELADDAASKDGDDIDDAAGLARRFAANPPPSPPAPPSPDVAHAIGNLRAEMDALSGYVRKLAEAPAPIAVAPEPESPKVDPRAAAVEAVRRAADERRRKAMVGGDPILAIKLAEVAHWSRSGKEAAIVSMSILAEAQGNGAWQEAAADIVTADDSLMRVCVRTWAVEMAAISEIEQADGDMIKAIASGATAALAAIQG